MCEEIAESFKFCLHGFDSDHQPITPQGYRFVIWGITGDNEHHVFFLGIPHWSMNDWCGGCNCNKSTRNGLALGERQWVETDVAEDLARRKSTNPIFTTPGTATASVEDDPLHDLYTNGVLNALIGSALRTIYKEGPGKQSAPAAHRLGVAWQRIKELSSSVEIVNEMSQLSLSHIHTPDKAHSTYPFFKAKGHHTKALAPVIAKLCQEASDGSEMNLRRNRALKAISQFSALLDVALVVPSDAQAAQACKFMDEFLEASEWLKCWAQSNDRMFFHIVNKHHYCWHLSRKFKYLNPRFTWAFKTEDYVGAISTLGHNCSMGKTKMHAPRVLCEMYRECYHLG